MLPTRDPPQDKRPTQTESEELETNFPGKRTGIKSSGSNTHIRQNRLQEKGHNERPRRSLHNTERKYPPRRYKHWKHNVHNIRAPNTKGKSWRTSRKILTATQLEWGILIPHCQKWRDLLNKISTTTLWHRPRPWMKWT